LNFSPLIISIKVSVIATIITFFLGIIGARVVVKMKRGKGLVDGIITLPMILPPTVVGFFLLLLFGKNSPLGRLLMNFDISIVFTWVAAVIASTVVSFPLMYRTVRGAFEDVDSDMIAAARTLGLSETKIFWKIIVPNVFPSIMAGTILAFARALGEFGATIMIAGNIPGRTQTMAVAVYTAVQSGNRELAYKWVAIICTISFASMFLMNYITSRHVKKNVKRGGL
jgi:molybdate transport system permease protein